MACHWDWPIANKRPQSTRSLSLLLLLLVVLLLLLLLVGYYNPMSVRSR